MRHLYLSVYLSVTCFLITACQNPASNKFHRGQTAQFAIQPQAYEATSGELNALLEAGLSDRWYNKEQIRYFFETKYTSAAGTICRRFYINTISLTNSACKLGSSWRLLPPINQQQ